MLHRLSLIFKIHLLFEQQQQHQLQQKEFTKNIHDQSICLIDLKRPNLKKSVSIEFLLLNGCKKKELRKLR